MPSKERGRDHPRANRPALSRVLNGGPSKLRGVIWHKSNGKWEARIYEAGKQRFLGYYTSEVAAAKAYDSRAVQLHGAAAKVNFPEDHEETRFNAPAKKAQSPSAAALPSNDSLPEHLKRRSPKGSSWNSTSTRPSKRKDESGDDDYVQPDRLAALQTPDTEQVLRQPSTRRRAAQSCSVVAEQEADGSESGQEDEESLEQGAVEVLAKLFSGGSSEAGSWQCGPGNQASGKSQGFTEEEPWPRDSSPPASSTGASPAPAPKVREWVPSLFVATYQGESPAGSSCEVTEQPLQTPAHEPSAAMEEDCADSHRTACELPKKHWGGSPSNDGSCSEAEMIQAPAASGRPEGVPYKGVSWNSVCRKWVAVIWDRQAKRARHIGTFSDPLEAAHAYDEEANRMQGATPNFPPADAKAGTPPPASEARSRKRITTAARVAAAAGRGRATRGSSRFRGVSWCEKGQKWRALIWDGHRQHFLGHFKSEEEGARAYDRALLTRKKKDGLLNFPLSDYADCVEDPEAFDFLKPGQANVVGCVQGGKKGVKRPAEDEDYERLQQRSARVQRQASRLQALEQLDEGGREDEGEGSPSASAAECVVLEHQADGLARSKTTHGSSQYRGVSWASRSGKWRAQMWLGTKVQHLGFFDQELEAALAYDKAVALHRGSEASTNFGGRPSGADARHESKLAEQLEAGYRGVRWHERNSKWEARIFDGNRQISLGYFDAELEAAAAFDAAAIRLRGPFASTNFAPGGASPAAVDAGAGGDSRMTNRPGDNDLRCHTLLLTSWGSKKRRN